MRIAPRIHDVRTNTFQGFLLAGLCCSILHSVDPSLTQIDCRFRGLTSTIKEFSLATVDHVLPWKTRK